jgi:LSD1 subclass zinc finger protein
MPLESIACNNCGAPLQVPEGANFVTCVHCDTQLAVKRSGNARFTEAIEDLREQVEKLTRQNELEALDREWEMEKESFMVSGKHGLRQLPTKTGSLIGGIVIAVFGLFWTVMAFSITGTASHFGGGFGGLFSCFPLFGLLFVAGGIATSVFAYRKAGDYELARRRYKRRRRDVLRKPDDE